jgi:Tol biopolymer transport system component
MKSFAHGTTLLLAAAACASPLVGVRGTDAAGRTAEDLVAGKAALVLLTTPRVAAVGPQLRLLRFLYTELGDEVAVLAVVYGEQPATLAKFREGMPFPVVAGTGGLPEEVLGEDGKLPMFLALSDDGDVRERFSDVPDPLAAAEALKVSYGAGPPGPPQAGDLLPDLIMAASDGEAYNLRTLALEPRKTIVYLFEMKDERRGEYLAALQRLADDLGDEVSVIPVILGASVAAATKIAESEYLDVPVLAGGPLAARRLVGGGEPPVLIVAERGAVVAGAKYGAAVPTRDEIVAEESGPAEEGPPLELAVERVTRLTAGLRHGAVPVASFTADGRAVVFHGYFDAGDVDHLWEISIAGKGLRQISLAPAPDVAPDCSADGVHVAFASGRSGGSEIWTCERVHGEFTQITKSGGSFGEPRYSADGEWLVASRVVAAGEDRNLDVWTMNARGRRMRPVAETFDDEIEPAFSADGTRIFFASDRDGDWDVFSTDLEGGKRRRLTDPGRQDRMPAPSPSGDYVVFASQAEGEPYKLWAMNVDGSSKTQLTFGSGDDLYPRFSRGGGALVFVSNRSGSFEIYKMNFEAEPDYDLPRPARPLARAEVP